LEQDQQVVVSSSLNVAGRVRNFGGRRFVAYDADFGQRADLHLCLKTEPTFGCCIVHVILRQATSCQYSKRSLGWTFAVENSFRALGANQDLLVQNEWKGVDVADLVRVQLGHLADLMGSRITVHGSPVRLNAAAAQAIGLALHELATNAGKYGALSAHAGRVDVDWRFEGDRFAMSWIERNGPPVSRPQRCGFGSVVIASMAERAVEGEVELDYAPSGLVWHLTCSAANALELTRNGAK
jgi:two-component sensor histidine kinase